MGRFPQSRAKKGSQKWIQELVNERPETLNSQIKEKLRLSKDEKIRWLSPIRCEKYAEYRDQAFIDLLDVKLQKIPLVDFWPNGGPQWDALGRGSSGNLFLVEAKSHIRELVSTLEAKDSLSVRRIRKSLDDTKDYLNSKSKTDWTQGFYQYTNRLAHLYLLRQNQLPAYLVFVYLLNDSEMRGPTAVQEWKGALKLVHSYLGIGRHKLQKFIADIFIDVTHL